MRIFFRMVTIFCFIAVTASSGLAETRYVTDVLVITVRTGKGNNYQIIETIRTGTPVEVLEEGKTYLKIRTPKGNEGYALTQYITSTTPKSLEIKRLTAEVDSLRNQLEQQQQEYKETTVSAQSNQEEIDSLTKQLETARATLKNVQNDYDTLLQNSQNVVSLGEENEGLIEQNKQLNNELIVLREENSNFHRSNMIQWFLAGAGVFFFGWLIGKISRKKQRGFSRL